ncbi:follicular epithelium yolk protein subunit [Polaribacter sp. L3A8]|uniref:follicular epithelium yolk protein subunit n=1 Tax=Polaribacter sp. L3A8 TaxID=2686361 RepID=UPI00131B9D37|nr:follicular epithelium yolk protein subunit [Polaribacter sp. L3A8]
MGIVISITAATDANASKATATGSIQHIITDTERSTFKLSDSSLKNAVGKYFGKNPNDAYLHSPTPWNDLYRTYGWSQVSTVLVPIRAEILGISSKPDILATKTFTNNSSVKGSFNASISEQVSNTVTSSWSTGGTLSISEAIEVGVNIEVVSAKSTTTLSYSQSWSIGESKSETTTVGSSSGVSVDLDPGQSVEAKLSASKGAMQVKVTYRAYLTGSVAVNYNPTFKGHHFFALPVASVMSAAGIKNSVESTEVFDIGFYSDGKIEIIDAKGKMLQNFAVADQRG